MDNQSKRLYRSKHDAMLGGVCGGLAEYFNIDAVLVRLAFVVLALAGGPGVLAYIIMWVVMPLPTGALDAASDSSGFPEELAQDAETWAEDQWDGESPATAASEDEAAGS